MGELTGEKGGKGGQGKTHKTRDLKKCASMPKTSLLQWVFGRVDSTTRYFETSAFYSNENDSTYFKTFVKRTRFVACHFKNKNLLSKEIHSQERIRH